jgi:hypothetical protein
MGPSDTQQQIIIDIPEVASSEDPWLKILCTVIGAIVTVVAGFIIAKKPVYRKPSGK